MFELLIIVAVYAILAFLLAWIVGIVAHEEITIMQGVGVLLLTLLVSIGADMGLMPLIASYWLALAASIAVSLGALTLFTKLIAQIGWKESAIIAVVYTTILTIVGLILPG